MALAYLQSRLIYFTGNSSTLAFLSDVADNSLIIAAVTQYRDGGGTGDSGMSDTQGNQYSKVGDIVIVDTAMSLEIWWTITTAAGALTITCNPTGTTSSTSLAIHEFSGTDLTAPVDVNDPNVSAATAYPFGGPITPNQADTLLFGGLVTGAWGAAGGEVINPTWSSGTGYVADDVVLYNTKLYVALQGTSNNQPDTSPTYWEDHGYQLQEYEDGDTYSVISTNYKILTSASAVYRRWKLGGTWATGAWAVGFKAASSGTQITSNSPAFLKGAVDASSSAIAYQKGSQDGTGTQVAFSAAVTKYLYPSSDISAGNWKKEDAGVTDLYLSLDEQVSNDADYVILDVVAADEYFEVALTDPGGDIAESDVHVVWRAKKEGSETVVLRIELREGATIRASTTVTLTAVDTGYSFILTSGERASISNWNDLRLRFIVDSVT